MRLPWPFGRAQRAPSSSGDGAAAASGAGGASAPPPERPTGNAWRELPALAETVGPPPLVAPNRPFAAGLAAGEPPAPILAPLSHGRSLEAPRGLVVGVARPTEAAHGPALPAPVQRSPLASARRTVSEVAGDPWGADGGDEPETPAAAMAAPAMRRLPVGEAAASPGRPLTVAPEPIRPAPLVGLVAQPRARGRAAAPAPAGQAVTPAVQRAAAEPTPAQAAPPAPRMPAPDAPRLTIGQARRLGLGAPIGGGPIAPGAASAPPVQRAPLDLAAGGAVPTVASSAASGPQRAPRAEADMPLVHDHSTDDAGTAQEARGEPQRSPEAGAAASASASPAAPVIATLLSPSRPSGAEHGTAPASPILSSRPLRARVQRAPLTLPSRAPEEPGVPAPDAATAALPTPKVAPTGGPVKIHRGSDAASLSKALDARSFTHGGEIFMPDSHGPLTSGKGRALLAHELTHVVQQRRLGGGLPGEQTPAGRSMEAEAVAAERAPDMTLALPRQPEAGPDHAGATTAAAAATTPPTAPGPAAAGDAHAGHAHAGAPGAQRAPASGGETAATGAGAAAPTGGRRPGSAHTEQELEVLAHQLYQRIGRHLRRELLVDRERAGFALDLP